MAQKDYRTVSYGISFYEGSRMGQSVYKGGIDSTRVHKDRQYFYKCGEGQYIREKQAVYKGNRHFVRGGQTAYEKGTDGI